MPVTSGLHSGPQNPSQRTSVALVRPPLLDHRAAAFEAILVPAPYAEFIQQRTLLTVRSKNVNRFIGMRLELRLATMLHHGYADSGIHIVLNPTQFGRAHMALLVQRVDDCKVYPNVASFDDVIEVVVAMDIFPHRAGLGAAQGHAAEMARL